MSKMMKCVVELYHSFVLNQIGKGSGFETQCSKPTHSLLETDAYLLHSPTFLSPIFEYTK